MRWSLIAILLAVPAVGHAQLTSPTSQFWGGVFEVEFTSPTSEEGSINCNQPSSTCRPLNLASCSETPREIRLRVRRTINSPTIAENSELIVWVQPDDPDTISSGNYTGDCVYANDANDKTKVKLATVDINTWSPFVAASGGSFAFPEDLDNPVYNPITTADFLGVDTVFGNDAVPNVCATPGRKVYRICFGITADGGTTITGGANGAGDPRAFARIVVDTKVPEAPTNVKTTSLDGAIGIHASVADTSDLGLFEWVVLSRPATTNVLVTTTPSDCKTWDEPKTTTFPVEGASLNESIAAKNGEPVEVCVFLRDEVGNESTPSPTLVETAVDQCDFIECYPPGKLTPGYCSATPAELGALLGLLALTRKIRARKGARS